MLGLMVSHFIKILISINVQYDILSLYHHTDFSIYDASFYSENIILYVWKERFTQSMLILPLRYHNLFDKMLKHKTYTNQRQALRLAHKFHLYLIKKYILFEIQVSLNSRLFFFFKSRFSRCNTARGSCDSRSGQGMRLVIALGN